MQITSSCVILRDRSKNSFPFSALPCCSLICRWDTTDLGECFCPLKEHKSGTKIIASLKYEMDA